MPPSIRLDGYVSSHHRDTLLSPDALNFLVHLETQFRIKRKELLYDRTLRQKEWDSGKRPQFLDSTDAIRKSEWSVVATPNDLKNRHVEITGPAERKMMINALNSGANVFMADLEDACSPTWTNILQSHENLKLAVRRQLDFESEEGKTYKLQDSIATLMVRPRGWHLVEKNFVVEGEAMSASLFDFGLYFFHNAKELLKRDSGPYFYLPKMESHLEARLWNEVFTEAERYLGVAKSSIRVTALIETITAAFEMEEILWELKSYIIGLNAGRWDYLFSFIKKFGASSSFIFPDRQQLSMTVPFMRAYAQLLVKTCHKRGAYAIGGMSAFIPNRRDPQITEIALNAVRADKKRELEDGFDGTWVAHPDLVGVVKEVFKGDSREKGDTPWGVPFFLGDRVTSYVPNLLDTTIPDSSISLNGFKNNIRVAFEYMNKWLSGFGAVAIDNLMEDTATAEISRAQIWQWIHHECLTREGTKITPELYQEIKKDVLTTLTKADGAQNYLQAADILDELVLSERCADFLTLPAYRYLS